MLIDRKEEGLAPFMLVPVLFAGGISYLLNDSFEDDKAAGSLIGTPATPGPGTRAGVDAGNKMSTSGGKLLTQRTANYDPKLALDLVTREAGRFMVGHVKLGNTGNRFQVGWAGGAGAGQALEFIRSIGAALRVINSPNLETVTNGVDYYLVIVLKAVGAYFFWKVIDSAPVWKLIWMSTANSTGSMMPIEGVHNAWGAGDNEHELLRVPEGLWLPTPLIYDTFTDSNGTSLDAHDSNTSGPDNQDIDSLTGVEQSGDWDIQSNRANPDGAGIHTWDMGKADVFADLVVNGGAAGNPGLLLRFTDTSNYWYLQADRVNNQLELHEVDATVDTVRATAGVVINDSTDYTLRVICEGKTIKGFINGVNLVSYASAALNEGATRHGLFADDAACEFDNFLVFARK